MLNAADFGVQTRKRLFWTNFKVEDREKICDQTWDDVLETYDNIEKYFCSEKMLLYMNKIYIKTKLPINTTKVSMINKKYIIENYIADGKTRWNNSWISDTIEKKEIKYPIGKSRPLVASSGGGNNVLIDRRYNVIRTFTEIEKERLFKLNDNYTNINLSKSARCELLGNTIVVSMIDYILSNIN